MSTEIDISNKKYGKLTAIKKAFYKKGKSYWVFRCDCGNEKIIIKDNVVKGQTKSCGCLQKEIAKITQLKNRAIHKKSRTRLYNVYSAIKARCYNKNVNNYNRYGGRGITVCDEWKNNFMSFYNWAIKNGYKENEKRGLCTIDRIDNNGNYCPENCRFVNNTIQARNTRKNHNITINNETKTLTEWIHIYKICQSTFFNRKKKGFSDIEALTKPVNKTKKN